MVLSLAGAAETAGWWSPTAAGAYATFLAVLVSLGLGVASIRREESRAHERREQRRRAYDAKVSAHAYALRRQLREWVRDPLPEEPRLLRGRAHNLTSEESLDPAEERALEIVTAAAEASPGTAEAARRQYVLFYRAALILNRASAAGPDLSDVEYDPASGREEGEPEWPAIVTEGVPQARELLQECIEALTEAIDEELLAEETRLDSDGD